MSKRTTEQFVIEAKALHGDQYEYSNSVYEDGNTKTEIRCPLHGPFWMRPYVHLAGQGCRRCGLMKKNKKLTQTQTWFVEKAIRVHSGRYDYSKTVYEGINKPITIVCPLHGTFDQKPHIHLGGSGCPRCARTRTSARTTAEFIERAKNQHGDTYDYSHVQYRRSTDCVTIICSQHGKFRQKPVIHLGGSGCPRCAASLRAKNHIKTTDWFITRANEIHSGRYDYSDTDYVSINSPVAIGCSIHGTFHQKPMNHLAGNGCRLCNRPSIAVSSAENQILAFINSLGVVAQQSNRSILESGYEIDIVCPEKKVGIEFCGLYWHSEASGKDRNYHVKKLNGANARGYDLITIFEDEWRDRQDVVKSILLNRLLPTPGYRVGRVERIDPKRGRAFLDRYHIQGADNARHYYGGFSKEGALIGVMSFGAPTRQSSHEWELRRFATDARRYHGLASKLFKTFRREFSPRSVVSFSDRRWFSGKMYQRLGFQPEATLRPDYSVIKKGCRYYKGRFRKKRLKQLYPDDNGSEREILDRHGYDRIWDCGKIRWVWRTPV